MICFYLVSWGLRMSVHFLLRPVFIVFVATTPTSNSLGSLNGTQSRALEKSVQVLLLYMRFFLTACLTFLAVRVHRFAECLTANVAPSAVITSNVSMKYLLESIHSCWKWCELSNKYTSYLSAVCIWGENSKLLLRCTLDITETTWLNKVGCRIMWLLNHTGFWITLTKYQPEILANNEHIVLGWVHYLKNSIFKQNIL